LAQVCHVEMLPRKGTARIPPISGQSWGANVERLVLYNGWVDGCASTGAVAVKDPYATPRYLGPLNFQTTTFEPTALLATTPRFVATPCSTTSASTAATVADRASYVPRRKKPSDMPETAAVEDFSRRRRTRKRLSRQKAANGEVDLSLSCTSTRREFPMFGTAKPVLKLSRDDEAYLRKLEGKIAKAKKAEEGGTPGVVLGAVSAAQQIIVPPPSTAEPHRSPPAEPGTGRRNRQAAGHSATMLSPVPSHAELDPPALQRTPSKVAAEVADAIRDRVQKVNRHQELLSAQVSETKTEKQMELERTAKKLKMSLIEVESLSKLFSEVDVDGSGSLTRSEFRIMLRRFLAVPSADLPESRVERFWWGLEKEADGTVSWLGFIKWWTNNAASVLPNHVLARFR